MRGVRQVGCLCEALELLVYSVLHSIALYSVRLLPRCKMSHSVRLNDTFLLLALPLL